nr:hypothetical protein [Acidobacteriota bacterium]
MRKPKRISMSVGFVLVSLMLSLSVFAQENPPPPDKPEQKPDENVIIMRGPGPEGSTLPAPPPPNVMMGGPGGGPMGDRTFTFISSEMSFDGKVVKGMPYSAEAVTEVTQTLGDGNRIVRKSTASIYRDSEGRTRRDQTLGSIGPFAAAGDPPQTIFINDPVTGFNFVLDPRTRTARKLPLPRIENLPGGARAEVRVEERVVHGTAPAPGATEGTRVMIYKNEDESPGHYRTSKQGPKPKKESLGKQTIEGVEADGTRMTITIPAGEIGNERPIQIVTERWYSPELQAVVMSKNSDPFVGDSVYRLTNINRNEPARSLFEVPSDYKIRDVPAPPGIRIM